MSGRILIVEDSASIALTCRLHLDGLGHTLLAASDGQSALEILRTQSVDCILLDLDLPDMNGAEILRLVRHFTKPPAVVVVTGRNSVQQAELAATQGAFDYLVKPFNGARLVTTVRNALAQGDLQRALDARLAPVQRTHRYEVRVTWTGNLGEGTTDYRGYSRDHVIEAANQVTIAGSSDPKFRGDMSRWNPEQLFVGTVCACHKLWYLHLCAEAGVVVENYVDDAVGIMAETSDGSGKFTEIALNPVVTIRAGSNAAMASILHIVAHEKCFIANSVNFPVHCQPKIVEL